VYFEYICWKFAGRLLDRVNTPLETQLALGVLRVYEYSVIGLVVLTGTATLLLLISVVKVSEKLTKCKAVLRSYLNKSTCKLLTLVIIITTA